MKRIIFMVLIMVAVAVAVRWLEQNFGANVALFVFAGGAVLGLAAIAAEWGASTYRRGVEKALDANAENVEVFTLGIDSLQKTQVQSLKNQGAAVRADSTIRVLDAKQADRLAKEAIGAYKQITGHAQREAANAPTWQQIEEQQRYESTQDAYQPQEDASRHYYG